MEGACASRSCLTENTLSSLRIGTGDPQQSGAGAGTAVNRPSVPSCLAGLGDAPSDTFRHSLSFQPLRSTKEIQKKKVKRSFYVLCSLASALKEADGAPDPKAWPPGTGRR